MEENEDIIIGKNPVIAALQSERTINKVLVSEQLQPSFVTKLSHLSKNAGTTLQKTPKKKLDQLASGNHQGVVAYTAPYAYAVMDDILADAAKKHEEPFIIILDQLEDPYNLGAILRTADAAGAHGVIVPKRRSVGLTAAVAKTAAGALEHVPVVRVTNIARTIEELKTQNIWVVGTDQHGSEDYRLLDGRLPLALVVGNEGKGISRLVKDKCDWTLSLPMRGYVSSLNASVACSLLLYEVYRKRFPAYE